MTVNENPVFVFVPGAWHTADGFDAVRDILTARGYESAAVVTPSVGSADNKTGLYADIGYTRGIVFDFVSKGRKVIIVGHSYGGSICSSSVEGLGWAERSKAGLVGGVISVVWLAAFVTQKGQATLDLLGGKWLPWMQPKDDGYVYSSEPESIFYHDMTAEAQQSAISKLQPQPRASFVQPVTYESWHVIPSFYIFCDQDKALPLPFQEAFAAILKNPGTFHIDSSHSPFFSAPEKVVEGLELAYKDAQQKI